MARSMAIKLSMILVFALYSPVICSTDDSTRSRCETNTIQICQVEHFWKQHDSGTILPPGRTLPLTQHTFCRQFRSYVDCVRKTSRLVCGIIRPDISKLTHIPCADGYVCKEYVTCKLRHQNYILKSSAVTYKFGNTVKRTKLQPRKSTNLLGKGARTSVLKSSGTISFSKLPIMLILCVFCYMAC